MITLGDPALQLVTTGVKAYKRIVTNSPATPLLSRPRPVRRTGYDLDLRVANTKVEADGVLSLTLASADGLPLPRWTPGAHLDVFMPSGRQRQYSLCGDPTNRYYYRIAVRLIADGNGSREIHEDLHAGDVLRARGPRNAFPLIEAPSYLFIAGGIGITPILPMVRHTYATGVPLQLAYLGRSRASMPFLDELRRTSLSRRPAAPGAADITVLANNEVGRSDLAQLIGGSSPGTAIYVCGPPPMLDEARALATELNPTASLHTERFSAPPVVGGAPFSLTLARTGTTVSVAADESTLAAVRRVMPGVAYSCQQGFCGSCKVRVVAGEPEHRDNVLLERDRAEAMLICVSRSSGDSLVLDL